jgi:hypothetical protein
LGFIPQELFAELWNKAALGGLHPYVRQGLAAKPETIEDFLVVDQDQFFSCLVGGSLLRKPWFRFATNHSRQ